MIKDSTLMMYHIVMSAPTLAPVMSRAPPCSPCPRAPSSRERGLPSRLWDMNWKPALLSCSVPLKEEPSQQINKRRAFNSKTKPLFCDRSNPRWPRTNTCSRSERWGGGAGVNPPESAQEGELRVRGVSHRLRGRVCRWRPSVDLKRD